MTALVFLRTAGLPAGAFGVIFAAGFGFFAFAAVARLLAAGLPLLAGDFFFVLAAAGFVMPLSLDFPEGFWGMGCCGLGLDHGAIAGNAGCECAHSKYVLVAQCNMGRTANFLQASFPRMRRSRSVM